VLFLLVVARMSLLVRGLQQQAGRLDSLACSDQLTGLLNRRGMLESIPALLVDAAAAGHPVSVMIADIDHFKHVNDTYGHDTGDRVLSAVAAVMRAATRSGGLLVRLGGEEIAWIDHFPTALDAARAAERLRAGVEDHRAEGLPAITTSIGVVTDPTPRPASLLTEGSGAQLVHDLLTRADTALYEAKHAGRNRVVVAGVRTSPSSGVAGPPTISSDQQSAHCTPTTR
jgi:diguanylate cyclase (GGDEF)-like protein